MDKLWELGMFCVFMDDKFHDVFWSFFLWETSILILLEVMAHILYLYTLLIMGLFTLMDPSLFEIPF